MMERLILFDLDGTLIRSHHGFIAFNEAIQKTFGLSADIRTVIPDGNTDPLILEDIFATANLEVEITRERWETFAFHLHQCYTHAVQKGVTRIFPLPGVLELVKELAEIEGLYQGVVTGNIETTGRLKLDAAGLGPYLGLGAYGSDSRNRTDLPRIAKERWEKAIGRLLPSSHCTVVGDTPKDLDAARKGRMKCLLVGTGRYPLEELELSGPDACLSDFTDTKATVEALLRS
ncbi:MAG: HAD family hydrolase [Candidatus Binatia bacterium]